MEGASSSSGGYHTPPPTSRHSEVPGAPIKERTLLHLDALGKSDCDEIQHLMLVLFNGDDIRSLSAVSEVFKDISHSRKCLGAVSHNF